MDERETPGQEPETETPAKNAAVDSQGRRLFDENGQPIHWATPGQRVMAFVLALVVIGITIAFAYSIATGDLFRR